VREALAHNLDSAALHLVLYRLAFFEHDLPAMTREAGAIMGKPGEEDLILAFESSAAAYGGQFAKSRELKRRAIESAQRAGEKETAAGYFATGAYRESMVGNIGFAKQQAQAALAASDGSYTVALSALTFAAVADQAQVARLSADLARRFPEDTSVQSIMLPMIRAASVLAGGKRDKNPQASAQEAIDALAPALPYEIGFDADLLPAYLRGQAYLILRHGSDAAVEFQKILDHPTAASFRFPLTALAHLQLGRAYTITDDTTKAKTAYQDFFALWKDADPDIPILKQAKTEYANLH
jgi:hypothetical protein